MPDKKETKEKNHKETSDSKKESSDDKKENKTEIIKKSNSKKEIPKIDANKFRDTFVNINPNSPSLEQVTVAPKTRMTLETNLAEIPIEKSKDEIKYNAINYSIEDKKIYEENIKHKDENLINNKNNLGFQPELEGMKNSYEENMSVKTSSDNFEDFKTHDPFQKVKKEYEFR